MIGRYGLIFSFLCFFCAANIIAAESGGSVMELDSRQLRDDAAAVTNTVVIEFSSVTNMPANPNAERLVWISPGTFIMGSPGSEKDRYSDEGPQTRVQIGDGFWMAKYEVTQEEYLSVMGINPSYFDGNPKRPVEQVTWEDAVKYCRKLTQRDRSLLPKGYAYRLPTEAEWEYACRAGSTNRFSYGDDADYENLKRYAWYWDSASTVKPSGAYYLAEGRYHTTHPVGQRRPNDWGLYDMHGNVWEWCLDWYSDMLPGGYVANPRGPVKGLHKVYRGGSWYDYGWYCRSSARYINSPEEGDYDIGFRVVLALEW